MGEVSTYTPHERLVLSIGHRRRSQARAHRDFERHGSDADTLRAGMNSPQGWPLILAEFRRWMRARSAETNGR